MNKIIGRGQKKNPIKIPIPKRDTSGKGPKPSK